MLAILARSGQFLPVCLTFGPHNGPEDFSYVVDRIYSPGRDAKRRFCTEWQAYVDDLTVRTGRAIDGEWYTDEEFSQRVRKAVADQSLGRWQSVEDALDAQGFLPEGIGSETKGVGVELPKGKAKPRRKPKYDPVCCDRNNPYAHLRGAVGFGDHGILIVVSILIILIMTLQELFVLESFGSSFALSGMAPKVEFKDLPDIFRQRVREQRDEAIAA